MDSIIPEDVRLSTLPPSTAGPGPGSGPSVLAETAAIASAVLDGSSDVPRAMNDHVLQNVMYKLVTFQGWLSRFSDERVRKSFLSGLFGIRNNTNEVLHSLDCIRAMMLPIPTTEDGPERTAALSGVNFFSKFLLKSDEEPVDRFGKPFPVRMSYSSWAIHLGQYSASSFWNDEKSSDLPPAVRPKTAVRHPEPSLLRAQQEVASDDPVSGRPLNADDISPFSDLKLNLDSISSNRPKTVDLFTRPNGNYHGTTNAQRKLYDDVVEDLEWLDLKPERKRYPADQREPYSSKPASSEHMLSNLPIRGVGSNYRQQEPFHDRPWKSEHVRQLPSDDLTDGDRVRSRESDWYDMISQIRHPKEAVAPRIFDGKDGYSLKDFLADYEAFFDIKYSGNERQKSQLLGGYLSGSARRAYDAMDGSRLIYSVLKPELLDWYKGEKSSLRIRSEAEFRKARMTSEDTLKIYALKLERLASQAFPDSVMDCERQLCRKFRKTVPDRFKQALSDGERSLALHDGRSKLGWAEMMRLAQAEDRHHRDRRDERSSESEPEPDCSVWYSRPKMSFDGLARRPSSDRMMGNRKVSFGRTFQNSGRYSPPPKRDFARNRVASEDITQCNWCGKRGHEEASCWAKTGACNICGSSNHDRNGCPKFDSSWSGFSPKCSACGGPHLGRNCDQPLN